MRAIAQVRKASDADVYPYGRGLRSRPFDFALRQD